VGKLLTGNQVWYGRECCLPSGFFPVFPPWRRVFPVQSQSSQNRIRSGKPVLPDHLAPLRSKNLCKFVI